MATTDAFTRRCPGAGVAGSQYRYSRHKPEHTVLYRVVEDYAPRFHAHVREQGASLPAFVRTEFERHLRCGRLEEGFVRVVCTGCRHEHQVAFGCKCRGFCPSCGARRMVSNFFTGRLMLARHRTVTIRTFHCQN